MKGFGELQPSNGISSSWAFPSGLRWDLPLVRKAAKVLGSPVAHWVRGKLGEEHQQTCCELLCPGGGKAGAPVCRGRGSWPKNAIPKPLSKPSERNGRGCFSSAEPHSDDHSRPLNNLSLTHGTAHASQNKNWSHYSFSKQMCSTYCIPWTRQRSRPSLNFLPGERDRPRWENTI